MTAPPPDLRSVGELLLDADHQARQLLLDTGGERTGPLATTWPEMIEAATSLWAAVPSLSPGSAAPDAMARIERLTQTHPPFSTSHTPPPRDPQLGAITDTFTRAADLVATHATPPVTEAARADIRAAQMRIMHTVHLATHAVIVALHEDIDHLHDQARQQGIARRANPAGVTRDQNFIGRLDVVEQLASSHIDSQYVAALDGQHAGSPEFGHQRLSEALIGWDIQLHRTLADHRDAQTLTVAARTQADMATTAAVILAAAAAHGHIPDDHYRHRLAPAVQASQRAWGHAGTWWTDLTVPGTRVDQNLLAAAGEVRAAGREITQDRTRWASPDLIAARVDLAAAVPPVAQSLIAAPDAAALIRGISTRTDLTGPARPLAARIRTMLDASLDSSTEAGNLDQARAWVSPAAIHTNQPVTLPQPLKDDLRNTAEHTVAATAQAATSASTLTSTLATQPPPEPGLVGRDADRRRLVFPGHVPWHPGGPTR